MKKHNSFVLYKDYREYIDMLSDQETGRLFKAIFSVLSGGEEPELEGSTKIVFKVIYGQIMRDLEKWEETCRKRSEAGKKGGRPAKNVEASEKQTKANESKIKQTKAKKAETETETENEYETENETDTDTEYEYESEDENENVSGRGETPREAPEDESDSDSLTPQKVAQIKAFVESCVHRQRGAPAT
ncbi:MAG: hypothetical protein E7495_06710 [Ruminococcus flavefaciens]|jgi:hypothetical protein|nr:hypothetical protein [Ruminococcus flavefaciens]